MIIFGIRSRLRFAAGPNMTLRFPKKIEREYIAISGITAIFIASRPKAAPIIRCSRDLMTSERSIRQRCPGARIECAYWVDDESEAQLIVDEVNAEKPVNVPAALRQIDSVAAHMNVILTEHDIVLARAKAAVRHIRDKIAAAQAKGELRWFNKMFRQWRLNAKPFGRSMTYAQARARLRRNMFHAVIGRDDNPPEVFPALPNAKPLTNQKTV